MNQHRITPFLAALACSLILSACATQQTAGGNDPERMSVPLTPHPATAANTGDDEALVLSQETQREPEFFVKAGGV